MPSNTTISKYTATRSPKPAQGKSEGLRGPVRRLVKACPAGLRAFLIAAIQRIKAGRVSDEVARAFYLRLHAEEYASRTPNENAMQMLSQILHVSLPTLQDKLDVLYSRAPHALQEQDRRPLQQREMHPQQREARSAATQRSTQSRPQASRPQASRPQESVLWQPNPSGMAGLSASESGGMAMPTVANNGWPWWVWGLMIAGAWWVFVKKSENSKADMDFAERTIILPRSHPRKTPAIS